MRNRLIPILTACFLVAVSCAPEPPTEDGGAATSTTSSTTTSTTVPEPAPVLPIRDLECWGDGQFPTEVALGGDSAFAYDFRVVAEAPILQGTGRAIQEYWVPQSDPDSRPCTSIGAGEAFPYEMAPIGERLVVGGEVGSPPAPMTYGFATFLCEQQTGLAAAVPLDGYSTAGGARAGEWANSFKCLGDFAPPVDAPAQDECIPISVLNVDWVSYNGPVDKPSAKIYDGSGCAPWEYLSGAQLVFGPSQSLADQQCPGTLPPVQLETYPDFWLCL